MTRASEVSPHHFAVRSFDTALWGDHPYGWWASADEVHAAHPADIERWFAQVRRPQNGVLVVVGDVDAATVVEQAKNHLGG